MPTIAIIDDTIIKTEPDQSVEPGHQQLVISDTPLGGALSYFLTSSVLAPAKDGYLHFKHDYIVDDRLLSLVDLAAHIRLTAPGMIQLPLELR